MLIKFEEGTKFYLGNSIKKSYHINMRNRKTSKKIFIKNPKLVVATGLEPVTTAM